MRKFLVVAAAAGLGIVAPAGALAFNPQPDPPKVAVRVDVGNAAPACRITLALPPLVTVSVGVPVALAGIFPPDICAPPSPTTNGS